jgi:hypothetical protein
MGRPAGPRAPPLEREHHRGRDAERDCCGQHVGDEEEQAVGGGEHGDEHRGGSLKRRIAREHAAEHGREDEIGIVLGDRAELDLMKFGYRESGIRALSACWPQDPPARTRADEARAQRGSAARVQ